MSSSSSSSSASASKPRKRARTTTSSKAGGNVAASKKPSQFADKLTKAITAVAKAQEGFSKNVALLEELRETAFDELDNILTSKQQELDYLEEEYANQKRQRRLQVDMDIREHGLTESTRILAEQGKVPVVKEEYEALQARYEALVQSHDDTVRQAVEDADARNVKHIAIIKNTLELQKKAEVATVEAKFGAQQTQIQIYKDQIARLAEDLNAQRELTKDVAASAATSSSHGFYGGGNGNGSHK
jgi:hypothetical protein